MTSSVDRVGWRGELGRLPGRLLVAALWTYRRLLSPVLGSHCRFAPSCSLYAIEAIERFGARRGSWLALRRLSRCHPYNAGGWDPVTER